MISSMAQRLPYTVSINEAVVERSIDFGAVIDGDGRSGVSKVANDGFPTRRSFRSRSARSTN